MNCIFSFKVLLMWYLARCVQTRQLGPKVSSSKLLSYSAEEVLVQGLSMG